MMTDSVRIKKNTRLKHAISVSRLQVCLDVREDANPQSLHRHLTRSGHLGRHHERHYYTIVMNGENITFSHTVIHESYAVIPAPLFLSVFYTFSHTSLLISSLFLCFYHAHQMCIEQQIELLFIILDYNYNIYNACIMNL
jgi:hypothetical protein